ncbi:metallophosphoesterase [Caulobacter sp. 17J65-9]|uniref:metallophosphoesterase n=1 Tax=Caulobacter sp. 17J65-9 TaxID=2709382 RepID=UPI0013CC8FEE|nr:metallophosphoesterase [Caulobacter sp. 17J65-9]NEX93389.1 metallophosphoesterase [Caulobacter sp. 17J65-9]
MDGAHALMILAWAGTALGPVALLALWRARGRWKRPTPGLSVFTALFVTLYGLGVWAFLVEPNTLVVRRVTVESATWSGSPLTVGLISDTHVAAPHVDPARVRRLVARMNAERPDVVLLLGDYAGGHQPAGLRPPAERAEILEGATALGGLRARDGVYAVLGNHDSWFDGRAVAAALEQAGVPVLENQARRVARPGGAYWIAGLTDLHGPGDGPSYLHALEPVADGEPVVVATHWPDPFVAAPPRVALTVAGHTHCGQVNFPVVGRLVHASRGAKRWACGLYDDGGRKIFVTGGVGVSVLPVRFRAPPEIVVLTLKAPD